MSFFSRVVSYVFNELLVEGLANSKTFQRFAVRTDAALKEAKTSGKLKDLSEATSNPGEAAKRVSEYMRTLMEDGKEVIEEVAKKNK
jgi:hypothetical protein